MHLIHSQRKEKLSDKKRVRLQQLLDKANKHL